MDSGGMLAVLRHSGETAHLLSALLAYPRLPGFLGSCRPQGASVSPTLSLKGLNAAVVECSSSPLPPSVISLSKPDLACLFCLVVRWRVY